MIRFNELGDQIGSFRWQRNRILIQGIMLCAISVPMLVHNLRTNHSILLRKINN